MKIERTEVWGFQSALRALRNPMDSWDKTDTVLMSGNADWYRSKGITVFDLPELGEADAELSCRLVRGGSEHRKFLRQIIIQADLTLPRYIWQEVDTYKVATVRNSCSTMHKLGHRDLTEDDFQDRDVFPYVLNVLNAAATCYRDKQAFVIGQAKQEAILTLEGYDIVRWMKKHLPEGFLQKATYLMSYETALAWIRQRRNHRNKEWSGPGGLVEWVLSLPYMKMWWEATLPSNPEKE